MKKKYRVTTRGKIVFPLVGLLLIYGLYLMIAPPPTQEVNESSQIEKPADETLESNDLSETSDSEAVSGEDLMDSTDESTVSEDNSTLATNEETKVDNCATNTYIDDESMQELKMLEEAGFTVYYEPNAYYVPEGDLAKLVEFTKIAIDFPQEQIVIEGNAHYNSGDPMSWDTEDAEKLGYTRGLVIKNYLIKQGVAEERIVIYNNKNEKPLNVDLSLESLALNRRVDVFFSQFMYKEIDTK